MNIGYYENHLLEVFSRFGMTQKSTGTIPDDHAEESLIDISSSIPKPQLLKDIAQLADSFLGMQSLSPGNAVNYLNFVIGALFELVSHDDQDIRMSADEGINQIVKVIWYRLFVYCHNQRIRGIVYGLFRNPIFSTPKVV